MQLGVTAAIRRRCTYVQLVTYAIAWTTGIGGWHSGWLSGSTVSGAVRPIDVLWLLLWARRSDLSSQAQR